MKLVAKTEKVIVDDQPTIKLNIQVIDTGIGIPKAKQQQLFDPFTQVDASTTRRFGGSGLGLAICHKIITLMQGDINVTSTEGSGSTFVLDLSLPSSNIVNQGLPSLDITGKQILVVESNDSSRLVLQEQLTEWGAVVYTQASSEQAIEFCAARQEIRPGVIFDAVLIDKQLPKINGVELGKTLANSPNSQNTPLIMMTTLGTKGDGNYLASIGFCGYFTKPIIPDDLLSALSVVFEGGDLVDKATPLVTSHYVRSLQDADTPRFDKTTDLVKVVNTEAANEGALSKSQSNKAAPATEIQTTESQAKEADSLKYKVLLVEDNKVNQQVAEFMLKKLGYDFELAENGVQAITSLTNQPGAFDLVLMDCQMPEMDGYEATKHIRDNNAGKVNQSLPIIALTANAMEGDKEKCLEAGMDDYLSKPIQLPMLKSLLEKYLY